MGHVCPQHAQLSPDYGSCAPLHMDYDHDAAAARKYAGEAERLAKALRQYADSHRLAAIHLDHAAAAAQEGDVLEAAHFRRAAASEKALGRAALHGFRTVDTIRDQGVI